MRHYSDVVLDRNGNVIVGATVTVKNYPALTTATVYGSNVVGPNVNPLTTDSNGKFEFWAPNGRYAITVSKSGINSVTQNDIQIFDLPVSVAEYGAVGDGSTDDTAAFQAVAAAIRTAGGGTLALEAGKTYKLFTGAVSQTFALDFTGCTNVHVNGNGATVTSALVDTALDIDFIFASGTDGLQVENLKFVGGNTTLGSGATGEKFIRYLAGAKNITVRNVDVRNCYGGIVCLVGDSAVKNTGVVLLNGYFQQCFYPLTPQNTDMVFARYKSVNGGRCYYVVAPASNHDIAVDSQSGWTSTECLLKVYANSTGSVAYNTLSDIRLNYSSPGRYAGAGGTSNGAIQLDIQQLTGSTAAGHIRDIFINFAVDGGAGSDKPNDILGMDKRDSAGNFDTAARGHTIRNVVVSGHAINWNQSTGSGILFCGNGTWTGDSVSGLAVRDVQIWGSPTSTVALSANAQGAVTATPFLTVENFYADGGISYLNATGACISEKNVKASGFDCTDIQPTSYTPTWSGGSPTIGNGNISGIYKKSGRDVTVTFTIAPGSTTTFGAGAYSFSLPINAASDGYGAIGSAEGFESGVAYHQGTCRVVSGGSTLTVEFGGGAKWGSATPWTFKNGDNVVATITYRCA